MAKTAKRGTKRKAAAKKSAKPAKKSRVKAIPDNYPQVGVYLRARGAADAIAFYEKIFGAKVRNRLDMPDGRIGHAELKIGKGLIMLSDEFPEHGAVGPKTLGGSSVAVNVYVRDVDDVAKRAEEAGAKIIRQPTDEFYGDRNATFEDPFGNLWMVQTHIEDVSPGEMKRRMKAMFGGDAPT
jgi:PhnB protein